MRLRDQWPRASGGTHQEPMGLGGLHGYTGPGFSTGCSGCGILLFVACRQTALYLLSPSFPLLAGCNQPPPPSFIDLFDVFYRDHGPGFQLTASGIGYEQQGMNLFPDLDEFEHSHPQCDFPAAFMSIEAEPGFLRIFQQFGQQWQVGAATGVFGDMLAQHLGVDVDRISEPIIAGEGERLLFPAEDAGQFGHGGIRTGYISARLCARGEHWKVFGLVSC